MIQKFKQQKGNAVRKLKKAKAENLVDAAVLPLIDYINSLDDFYTTSSCSGRISLFCHVASKLDDFALVKWHRKIDFDEVMEAINSAVDSDSCKGNIWLRQESSIFHIVSRDFDGAVKLLDVALKSGYKNSGIQVLKEGRFMVQVISTERIDTPITNNGKMLVTEDYIKFLVELANEKFGKVNEKLERFEAAVRENLK